MQKKINFEIDYDFARKEYDIKKDIEHCNWGQTYTFDIIPCFHKD